MVDVARQLALGFPLSWSHQRAWSFESIGRPGEASYFVDWDPGDGVYGERWTNAARDRDGVLLAGKTQSYHPTRIAQYALHRFGLWRANSDAAAKADFLAQARWLRDHQHAGGVYRFEFPWSKYGAAPGWSSAMAQGEAISVLLRAHASEPSEGFADAAMRAVEPFRLDVTRGGVVWRDGGDLFFEEIANDSAAHVLNGCIFALWGVWELWKCSDDPSLGELVERCAVTLRRWLPRYDTGWWTLYSLMLSAGRHPHIATLKYHQFHIAQMAVLFGMLNEPAFKNAAARWDAYARSRECQSRVIRATLRAIPERLLGRDTVAGGARS